MNSVTESSVTATQIIQGHQKLCPLQGKSTQEKVKGDSVVISNCSKLMSQINQFEKQLDSIFGIPEKLNNSESIKAQKIEEQLDKILGLDNIKLSKSDEKVMKSIDEQIEAILKDNNVTQEEHKQLSSLIKREDSILSKYEERSLSKDDEKKVDALFEELDILQGLKSPSDFQEKEAQNIYKSMNKTFEELSKLNNFFNDKIYTKK